MYQRPYAFSLKKLFIDRFVIILTICPSKLKSKLNTNAKQFKLIKNGQEVDIISTGTILVLDNDRSYTLVVTGDINGDSYHNELDLTLLINHLLDRTLIQNEIESMASDMNDDGEIDIVDLSIMNKKTLN